MKCIRIFESLCKKKKNSPDFKKLLYFFVNPIAFFFSFFCELSRKAFK